MITLHRRTNSAQLSKTKLPAVKCEAATRISIRTSRNRSRSPNVEISQFQVNNIIPLSQALSRSLLSSETLSYTPNPLSNHSILPEFRAKMIDWMIEVTSAFKCHKAVFFLAVKIMDKFFKVHQQALSSQLLHIIGVCCMFIASKFSDTRHRIRLGALREKIAHKKFTVSEILITEKLILKKLGFIVNLSTCYDFLQSLYEEFKIPNVIQVTAELICRISQIYYKHLEFKQSDIALSSVIIAARSLRQDNLCEKMIPAKGKDKITEEVVEKLSRDVDKYAEKFPGYTSVFDFFNVTITSRKPGPLFVFCDIELEQDQNKLLNSPNFL
ncbi:unnamed protein product [Blepharisma stoltei]|uniref:Cyclin-like domain-containing protein n=1 Tax=Blepharisma stoltei TaxID=1481888 RepID=A0AAU9JZX2_9CILI|nr:unnamed protein product [Blepharisma stoltei]